MSLTQPIENTSKIGRLGRALWQGWEWILQACFALLCIRFLIAALKNDLSAPFPMLIIAIGCLLLGFWRSTSTLFAFTALAPFISGLTQTTLLNGAPPLASAFSALWLGLLTRRLHTPKHLNAPVSSFPSLAVNLLTSAIFLSLANQFLTHFDPSQALHVLLNQPWQTYADQHYFLTSSFLWLQGLFFFKENNLQIESLFNKGEAASKSIIESTLSVNILCVLLFFLIQYYFNTPEGWTGAGYQSPYEDISSFGSISSSFFSFYTTAPSNNYIRSIFGLISLSLLAASWSRAAWLAGMTTSIVNGFARLPKRSIAPLIALCILFPITINKIANHPFWNDNAYLRRLGHLVYFENPIAKDPTRFNLYIKALKMIRAKPLLGHGIGSFYLQSLNYATPGDPVGAQANFAHNLFLQVAAEIGLPAAALFGLLCLWSLWRGLRTWLKMKGSQGPPSSHALLVLGVTLSLGAYLQTQMTANSLNVYVSNQFFFWFMMAALLSLTASREAPPQEGAARAD